MRHRVEGRKFGREADHRKALMNNLVKELVRHERIVTTHAKAKEARRLFERVITYGKRGEVHHRRLAYKILADRSLVKKVFDELAPRYENRSGGYTRIMQYRQRRGDNAPMAILEVVDRVEKETEESK